MQFIQHALKKPRSWILADQVWFELYRLLRNPAVLSKPLAAEQAAGTIEWYRNQSGWLCCAWEPDMMTRLLPFWRNKGIPPRNSFDLVLAVSLAAHGVKTLYTRNIRDFESLKLFQVTNPLD
ncbi:hypothetical protein [Marispirochaeta sp.]|jgi:predicted nucleic acid-binding protein|uniref:hypothetical protein n=1 Tax=Marispirochaeta sp. TaxID=2038653 RepID=UPI0029C8E1BF|nr:hypothetical protein [Marispirochaeta sp.]